MPIWSLILLLSVGLVLPQPAAAKGLLETLFGFLAPKPALKADPQPASRGPAGTGSRMGADDGRRANPYQSGEPSYSVPYHSSGRYKTVCVRLCDGYYFPINQSSTRRDFYGDAQQCRSRCNGDAQLFYMSPSETSMKNAMGLSGLAYGKLKTAFLYRKTLKPGCACKPEPWTVTERLRHQRYALNAEDGVERRADDQAPSRELASDDEALVVAARPKPVDPASIDRADGEVSHDPGVGAPSPLAVQRDGTTGLVREIPQPRRADLRRNRLREDQALYAALRPRPVSRAARQAKPKSWGLGAALGGGGLPPVRYKHRWPGQVD